MPQLAAICSDFARQVHIGIDHVCMHVHLELYHGHDLLLVVMTGDRTKEALLSFVETLVPSAGRPHYYVRCMPIPCN